MEFLENPEIALENIVESIRLDEARLERMKSSYSAITSLLANDKDFFAQFGDKIEVYAQGSASIGTTIKPINDDFDLDIVLHIDCDYKKFSPAILYNNLVRVFRDSPRYGDKYERKNRCVRINYKDDFHMDILPGFSNKTAGETVICVPDREIQGWTVSDPKGYTDWFLNISRNIVAREDFSFVKSSLETKEFEKINDKPLKDAVMVLKMYRNEYFKDDDDKKTPSIILTTLAGLSYKGSGTILGTLKQFAKYTRSKSSSGVVRIENPVLPSENLSERWEKDNTIYKAFFGFLDSLEEKIADLEETANDFELRESVIKSMVNQVNYARGVEHFSALAQQNMKENDFGIIREMAKPKTELHRPYCLE
ncbi:MAG: nucleotidyltransferase [Treponema sp.]|nr:nucleotidyltransferase [Treponema sp.]